MIFLAKNYNYILEFVKVMSKVLSAYISTIIFLCVNKFASIFLRQCKMAFYW